MAKELYESQMDALFGPTKMLLSNKELFDNQLYIKSTAVEFFNKQIQVVDVDINRAAIASLEKVKLFQNI